MHKGYYAEEKREIKNAIIKEYEENKIVSDYNKSLEKKYPTAPADSHEAALMHEELMTVARRAEEHEQFFQLAQHDFKTYIRDERQDEKSIIKDIKRTRKAYRNSISKKAGKAHLRESIGFVAELLERYVTTFKAALAVRHKKYIKMYEKKVNQTLIEYRADLDMWRHLMNEATPNVSKTIVEDIKAGREVPPIPLIDAELNTEPKQTRRLLHKDLAKFLKEEKRIQKRAKEHEEEMREMALQ